MTAGTFNVPTSQENLDWIGKKEGRKVKESGEGGKVNTRSYWLDPHNRLG